MWLHHRPSSLQQISRKIIRAVIEDVLAIIRVWEFVVYAILECWVIGYLSSCHDECSEYEIVSTSHNNDEDNEEEVKQEKDHVSYNRIPHSEATTTVPLPYTLLKSIQNNDNAALFHVVDDILPCMDEYSDAVFRKPKGKNNTTTKKQLPQQPSPPQQPSHHPNQHTKQQRVQQETSELLSRKAFLLLLFTLDQDHGTDDRTSFMRLQTLSEEVRDYLRIYMA